MRWGGGEEKWSAAAAVSTADAEKRRPQILNMRRLVNMWAVVMYVGQVLKDVLKLPRPLAPPVVKLEKRVDAEYGLPSTHAMAATALSFTLLLSAQERVQFQLEMGVFLAVLLSALVCLSRLYTGMHSALDVICGAAIAGVITISSYPLWQTLDQLQLHSPISPAVALLLPIFLCYRYPELGHYSTTRGDTTVILGAASGCWVGYWLNEQFGLTFEPSGPLPMPMSPVTINAFVLGVGRFMVGLSVLLCTRQTARWTSFAILCCFYGELQHDAKLKRRKEVEVPYYFSTYLTIGLMNTVLVNRLFVILGLL
ncbi:sphingosine-1-phosphate phosphatase 2 isoform X2 [Denticeps clupeoides]|uniref:sphingosine-1-phosphate phosphatase 2 isoform X2 n=1 Tax=Denticeps clupeoides TaxID=299321 RepID=UPI0010A4CDB1|nr:sphingosine-1-phosphate phosphatase 2 isoform X2 [Denticeps clupeoides]